MMNWKQLMSVAAIIVASSFLVRSLQSAYAIPNLGVNSGSNPYRSFYGTVFNGNATNLLTTPADQDFIVSTLISNRNHSSYNSIVGIHYCVLKVDGVEAMGGDRAFRQGSHAFTMGNGHLVVPAGSTLSVHGYTSTCIY